MVETETDTIHRTAFIYQAVAAPHQAFLPIGSEVPLVKKSSFPPGEAKNSEDFGVHHSTSRSVAWASGRKVGDPYRTQKFLTISIQWTAQLRELREANSLPYSGDAELWVHTWKSPPAVENRRKSTEFSRSCGWIFYFPDFSSFYPQGGENSVSILVR